MSNMLGVVTARLDGLRELGDVAGGLLGDVGRLDARPEPLGRGEDSSDDSELLRGVVRLEVVEFDRVQLRVRPVVPRRRQEWQRTDATCRGRP
jgi:hypothetical protein